NFANDLAVSIDERHSPLRFIAAERLRGRAKRRARGGLGRVGFLLLTFYVVYQSGSKYVYGFQPAPNQPAGFSRRPREARGRGLRHRRRCLPTLLVRRPAAARCPRQTPRAPARL